MSTLLSGNMFPTARVYAEKRPKGPLFSIVFMNPEEGSFLRRFLGVAVFAPLMLAAPGLPVWLDWTFGIWQHGWLVLGLLVVGIFLGCVCKFMGEPPFWSRVEIQIDLGQDRFNVFRKKRLTVSRPWTRLAALTIGEHPEVPLELEKKRGKMGPKQRQHCLFGHFGPGGAEKIILVARWEWPPQGSLFEVQQAIEWTRDMIGQMTELVEAQGGRAPPLPPPLD